MNCIQMEEIFPKMTYLGEAANKRNFFVARIIQQDILRFRLDAFEKVNGLYPTGHKPHIMVNLCWSIRDISNVWKVKLLQVDRRSNARLSRHREIYPLKINFQW